MQSFWKIAPTAVAVTALALVGLQTVRLGRLEKARVAPARAEAAGGEDGERAARLEKRVASLEAAVRRLVGIALTRAPAPGEKAGAPDPVLLAWIQDELKALRKDVDSSIGGETLATEEGRKKLKDLLRSVRKEERRERRERWQQVAQHLQREQLGQFSKDAGVDQATTDKIDGMLTSEMDKLRGLMRSFRSGEKDIPTAIAEARKVMDDTDTAARGMLTDAQYKAYEKMREENPAGRWLRRRLGLRR